MLSAYVNQTLVTGGKIQAMGGLSAPNIDVHIFSFSFSFSFAFSLSALLLFLVVSFLFSISKKKIKEKNRVLLLRSIISAEVPKKKKFGAFGKKKKKKRSKANSNLLPNIIFFSIFFFVSSFFDVFVEYLNVSTQTNLGQVNVSSLSVSGSLNAQSGINVVGSAQISVLFFSTPYI